MKRLLNMALVTGVILGTANAASAAKPWFICGSIRSASGSGSYALTIMARVTTPAIIGSSYINYNTYNPYAYNYGTTYNPYGIGATIQPLQQLLQRILQRSLRGLQLQAAAGLANQNAGQFVGRLVLNRVTVPAHELHRIVKQGSTKYGAPFVSVVVDCNQCAVVVSTACIGAQQHRPGWAVSPQYLCFWIYRYFDNSKWRLIWISFAQ